VTTRGARRRGRYEPQHWLQLADTLAALLPPGGAALLAHRPRHSDEPEFWAYARRRFSVEARLRLLPSSAPRPVARSPSFMRGVVTRGALRRAG